MCSLRTSFNKFETLKEKKIFVLGYICCYFVLVKEKVNIVWFKRDLRIHDNLPLQEATMTGLPTLPLYVVEPEYWQQSFASRRHWNFVHDCLIELFSDCTNLGQPLVIRVGNIVEILETISANYKIKGIFAHEESGNNWTYCRDKKVTEWCKNQTIPLHEYPTNGVVRYLKKRDDWSRIRNARMVKPLVKKPQKLKPINNISLGAIPSKKNPMFGDKIHGITQKGGRREGIRTLWKFLNESSKNYIFHLSAPGKSEKYCSRLSPHLTWGTLTVREVIKLSMKHRKHLSDQNSKTWKRNLTAFSSRLAWRCHFIQKIEDQPSIETKCMHPAFEEMRKTDHNEHYFQAWKKGLTGFPFIDACMRNLIYEGWITFRMRAMLMSFASYHLWLDWRKTGDHLAQLFTDYEPGIHYSQLQMQSGVTGINTIRIYNPTKQSQEHDKNGKFIKQWVPELSNVSSIWIHEPSQMTLSIQKDAQCIIGTDYPEPIVNQTQAAKSALAKITAIQKDQNFKDKAKNIHKKLGSRRRPNNKKKRNNAVDPQLSFKLEL